MLVADRGDGRSRPAVHFSKQHNSGSGSIEGWGRGRGGDRAHTGGDLREDAVLPKGQALEGFPHLLAATPLRGGVPKPREKGATLQ